MIERLCEAIGYPERIPEGGASAVLRVDGMEIAAEERNGGIILKYALTEDEGLFQPLAGLAAGRMLKEDAVLSSEPYSGGLFLWQAAPAGTGAHGLLRLFETFCDSCDWWRERVGSIGEATPKAEPGQVIMMP